jgi:peptide/nickel transport system ATP-binding protein
MSAPVLSVRDLHVSFPSEAGRVDAVRGVDVDLLPGRTLGIVGESGSGKSVTSLAVMGLLPEYAAVSGSITLNGRELLGLDDRQLSKIRGRELGMIFQDPMSSLTPIFSVGRQLVEALQVHQDLDRDVAWQRAVELLDLVGIPNAATRARSFPHEFSGGMRQRVVIAIAVANDPKVIIADEPTTALDVTVQAQILDLIDRLREEFNAAVVIITHDLGVVAEHCDNIMVMYAGKPAEYGDRGDIYHGAHHPYTWGLLQSITRIDQPKTERLRPIKGLPPSLIFVPPGCPFHPRCPYVMDVCRVEVPPLLSADGKHASACHLPLADKERIFLEEVEVRT